MIINDQYYKRSKLQYMLLSLVEDKCFLLYSIDQAFSQLGIKRGFYKYDKIKNQYEIQANNDERIPFIIQLKTPQHQEYCKENVAFSFWVDEPVEGEYTICVPVGFYITPDPDFAIKIRFKWKDDDIYIMETYPLRLQDTDQDYVMFYFGGVFDGARITTNYIFDNL